MKKSKYIIILITMVIICCFSVIKAQTADTVKVKLLVKTKTIEVNPDTAFVHPGDYVLFYTEEQSYTFNVTIDNYYHFFKNPSSILVFNVTNEDSVTLLVGSPPQTDSNKNYLVNVIDQKNPPAPPEAPPRIILNSTE